MRRARVEEKVEYILVDRLNAWSESGTFELDQAVLDNLESHLPKLPKVSKVLVDPLGKVLKHYLPVKALMNGRTRALGLRDILLRNTGHPEEGNGGICVETATGETSYRAGYGIEPIPEKIRESVRAGTKQVHVKFDLTHPKGDYADLSINGQKVGNVPVVAILAITGDSAGVSLGQFNTTPADCTMEIAFKGLTTVYCKPLAYQADSHQGWFYLDPLKDALRDGPVSTKTGSTLDPLPQDDGINALQELAISRFPSIAVSYTSGAASQIVEDLRSEPTVGVNLFGTPIGAAGYSYKVTSFVDHGSNKGFDIVFEAPFEVGSLLDRQAHVLAGVVKSLSSQGA
ncbi:hypothetical protein PUR61_07750 [Streptomyces sp. BE20]|uniref:hypothetical protein n=1 Tax=Streptomyces sp. BE20 TaxID=3002525 RepID=UPI002E7808E0|nr:hypothetical protein [Streptomyces sp. BE20]MEE1822085.1 hypothetical protein [Streptomyces sp. BE20]